MPQVRDDNPRSLSKDRAPKLQAKSSATQASYMRSLRDLGEGQDRAVFIKSTYHFAPFFCSPTEAGSEKPAPGQFRLPKVQASRKVHQVHCPTSELPSLCSPALKPTVPAAEGTLLVGPGWSQAHHRGPVPSVAGSMAGWRLRAVCLGAGSSV